MFTEEQLAERRKTINGTDAGTIMGCNPFKTAHTLWEEKMALRAEEDLSNNKYIKAGKYAEPMLIQRFEDETGMVLLSSPAPFKHPAYDFMQGNIDSWFVNPATDEKCIVECKTASARSAKYWGTEDHEFPENYKCQVAHYCNLLECDTAYIAVLIDSWDFRIYKYVHTEEFGQLLLQKELQFYECMQSGTPPPIVDASGEIIAAVGSAPFTIANDEIVTACEELSTLSAHREELREMVTQYMSNAEVLLDGFGREIATYKRPKASRRFDLMGFKKDNPELYDAYLKEIQMSRRLCMKGAKDE